MRLLTALICCSAVVSAAPQFLGTRDLSIQTGYERLTNEQVLAYKSTKADCWTKSNLVWPMNDTPKPIRETEPKQLNVFPMPTTKPGTLIVRNFCSYPIFYEHHGTGGTIAGRGTLEARGTFETPYIGTNWKASKSKDMSRPVQVEYNVPAGSKELWYNLSLIDCLVKKNGLLTKDATGCAGIEAGLQFGNKEKLSFQCAPNTWCDDQAYLYFENMCKNANPVRTCDSKLGVTMEFCASNRS